MTGRVVVRALGMVPDAVEALRLSLEERSPSTWWLIEETGAGVFEISRMLVGCAGCAKPLGPPTGALTVMSGSEDNPTVTFAPNVCRECTAEARAQDPDARRIDPGSMS